MCSSNPAPRRFIETPAASNSCCIQPWRTRTTSRPSLSRSSVASLRSLLVDIYPARLADAGLAADGDLVALTPSGSVAHERLVAARREGLAELLQDWSPEEHAEVAAMLSRLARAITAEAPPAGR